MNGGTETTADKAVELARPIVTIALTTEELRLVLQLLDQADLPGMQESPIEDATERDQALGLIYAERSLRARDLATVDGDGALSIDSLLLSLVSTCAEPEATLWAFPISPDGIGYQHLGYAGADAAVVHESTVGGIHYLSLLDDADSLVERTLLYCECEALVADDVPAFTVATDALSGSVEAARHDSAAAATLLEDAGVPPAAAQTFARALASSAPVVFTGSSKSSGGDTRRSEISIVRSDGTAWAVSVPDASDDQRVVAPIDTAALRDQLSGWLRAET